MDKYTLFFYCYKPTLHLTKIASSPPNLSRIKEICSSLQSLCPRHAPNWNQYMVQPQPPKVSLCFLCSKLEPVYGSTPARSVWVFDN
ncbi:hypothetical protein Peur_011056 [Populus x canadensis]